jgi:flagellar hook assembly protein FlgD
LLIPEAGNLSLIVYNTLGQQVRVLEQGPVDADFHRVSWDGQDAFGRSVSSGIYLVRMQSGLFNSVKKMMLLK